MRIEDAFVIKAPVERVWSVIRDAEAVAGCVPGCKSVEALDETHYRTVVEVALGPIKARFNLAVELVEERPPHFAATLTKGEEGGRASSVTARNELTLAEIEPGTTEIRYACDVTMVGRLGNYGLGLMKKKAQALGREFAGNLQAKLDAALAATAG